MTQYTLLPRADADVIDIWHYSARQWSTSQADKYVTLLRDAMASAASAPERGRSCAPAAPAYRRAAAGSHVIFYRVVADGILVARVLHKRMDFLRHL